MLRRGSHVLGILFRQHAVSRCCNPFVLFIPRHLRTSFESFSISWYLVDIDTELAQVDLGSFNLVHQLLVRLGNIVKGKNAEAETEEKKSAKGNESPEGKLVGVTMC